MSPALTFAVSAVGAQDLPQHGRELREGAGGVCPGRDEQPHRAADGRECRRLHRPPRHGDGRQQILNAATTATHAGARRTNLNIQPGTRFTKPCTR